MEQALLEKQGSRVKVISADPVAVQAMGANVLDPIYRAASAQAGLRQGESIANEISQFWNE